MSSKNKPVSTERSQFQKSNFSYQRLDRSKMLHTQLLTLNTDAENVPLNPVGSIEFIGGIEGNSLNRVQSAANIKRPTTTIGIQRDDKTLETGTFDKSEKYHYNEVNLPIFDSYEQPVQTSIQRK